MRSSAAAAGEGIALGLRENWRQFVSDASHPAWRARSLSIYRFWRDLGYAIGALSAGLIADAFGFQAAILAVAVLTFASGTIVALVMGSGITGAGGRP